MKTNLQTIAPLAFLIATFGLVSGCAQQHTSSEARIAQASEGKAGDTSAEELALTSGSTAAGRPPENRKIIYTADLELVVKDFRTFEQGLPEVVEAAGGFVAARKTDRRHGDHRAGSWTIRVPVAGYNSLLSGIAAMGFAKIRNETSQDVTEDYVDLQARISNQRKLEARILEMLADRSGKLTDLLEMERELSRVREEIERMEGRLRVLTDQTDLATIRLTVTEQATYEPPAAPTFGDRVAMAWSGSIHTIGQVIAGLTIVCVALVPWAAIGVPSLLAFTAAAKRLGWKQPSLSRA